MPGDALLSHCLSSSTMGAVGFHGRVRDGIGWDTDAIATRQWSRCDMRHCDIWVLKSIPCKVCSVFDQSLDGEGIGNLASC